ncbi:endonuclease domain-containing protein [Vibrio sp. DNB22_10_4]
MKTQLYNTIHQTSFRKQLRNNPTLAEARLWYFLRGGQVGAKFRRQYGVGDYVLDFYSPELRLAIEVDGDSHFSVEGQEHDKVRTEFLETRGIQVIRFTNREVLEECDGVVEVIREMVRELKR